MQPARRPDVSFRAGLRSVELLRFAIADSLLSGALIQRPGFEGVYARGTVVSADLSRSDTGAAPLSGADGQLRRIAQTTVLPTLADADAGFGAPSNPALTVRVLEEVDVAGRHVEDLTSLKRSGHTGRPLLAGRRRPPRDGGRSSALQPNSARRVAIARPMPWEAPKTKAPLCCQPSACSLTADPRVPAAPEPAFTGEPLDPAPQVVIRPAASASCVSGIAVPTMKELTRRTGTCASLGPEGGVAARASLNRCHPTSQSVS